MISAVKAAGGTRWPPVVPVEVSMRWFDSSIEPRVTLILRDITRQLEQEDAVCECLL